MELHGASQSYWSAWCGLGMTSATDFRKILTSNVHFVVKRLHCLLLDMCVTGKFTARWWNFFTEMCESGGEAGSH